MEPGSWAEWVGSIATALTFGGGAFLWRLDVRDKKRALAKKFFVTTAFVGDDDTGEVYFEVRVHNTNDTAIYMAHVSFFDNVGEYQSETVSELDFELLEDVVKPGIRKTTSIPLHIDPSVYDPVVSFWDSSGTLWHRRIRDNRYISRRRFNWRVHRGRRLQALRAWLTSRDLGRTQAAETAAKVAARNVED